jgi:hypothetical protein
VPQQQPQLRPRFQCLAHLTRQARDDVAPRGLRVGLIGDQRAAQFDKNELKIQHAPSGGKSTVFRVNLYYGAHTALSNTGEL